LINSRNNGCSFAGAEREVQEKDLAVKKKESIKSEDYRIFGE
jgi:hypothetical protein